MVNGATRGSSDPTHALLLLVGAFLRRSEPPITFPARYRPHSFVDTSFLALWVLFRLYLVFRYIYIVPLHIARVSILFKRVIELKKAC